MSAPISEPREYDANQEAKIRALIERHATYAESGPTFDETGRYLCGSCAYRLEPHACVLVFGRISFTSGSCRLWDRTNELAGRVRVKQLSQSEAQYAERPKAKGFGCSPRCEYASEARKPDVDSRAIWCGFWGLHVIAKACCSEEDGDDLVQPEENGDE